MNDINTNNIRKLDGGLLLVFHELMRTRKTTQVADQLGLSQPAISHALSRLRDLFNDPLFIRRPRGLEPTRRALELAPKFEALLDMAAETLAAGDTFIAEDSKRSFILGTVDSIADAIGPKLLNELSAKAPSVQVRFHIIPRAQAIERLRRGEIDCAIGMFNEPGIDIHAVHQFEERYCLAARKGHPILQPDLTYPDYLTARHVWAIAPMDYLAGPPALPDDRIIAATVGSSLSALIHAAQSDAIATCPQTLAQRHATHLGLDLRWPDFLNQRFLLSVVQRANVSDPGLDWFVGEVKAALDESRNMTGSET